jgi:hypothetical protein
MASRLGCTDPYRLRLCGRLIRDAARTSDSVPKQRAVVCALDQLSQALGIDPFCRDADTDEWSDDRGFAADLSRPGKATPAWEPNPSQPTPFGLSVTTGTVWGIDRQRSPPSITAVTG